MVYVKNFSADSSKARFQNRENHESGGFKSTSQDPAKPRCNKTDKNNTEMNETYPFNADALNAAFKEYSAAVLNKAERPSVLTKLHDLAQVIANLPDKVRHKEEERGL